MSVCRYTFSEYVELVRSFHGYPAPGVIIGGLMVDQACRILPAHVLSDALCETEKCLPDAIQMLTPCTIGNGWLKIVSLGRYALTLYDKTSGEGVRVAIDPIALEGWPEIRDWFLKFRSKEEQDTRRLLAEIEEAGTGYCTVRRVKVSESVRKRKHQGAIAVCMRCGEAFPAADGLVCLGCQNDPLWEESRGVIPPATAGDDETGRSDRSLTTEKPPGVILFARR